MSGLGEIELQEERYLELMTKMIADARHTQNNPPDQVPREQLMVDHLLAFLGPDLASNGGRLEHKACAYVKGRPNLIVTLPGTGDGTVSFVGMHMDVVTADDSKWRFPAFELTREGDEIRGRGVTDCLGHVALVADLLKTLAERNIKLRRTIVAVFIANEETSSVLGVGVDELVKQGEMKHLINGPLLWIDSADSMPCAGTAGTTTWSLTAHGKMGHSGLPHNAINPIILANEAVNHIMERFHADFPKHEKEQLYNFRVPSTMKPTQVSYPLGSQNQIPSECTISGDIRLIPFYDTATVHAAIARYVSELNADIESLPTRGPVNRYVLPDGSRGRVELTIGGSIDGVAVNMANDGFQALSAATKEVLGKCEHYSITGSLPLIDTLQSEGFDVNIAGFGKSDAYHADNEYALMADLKNGTKILTKFIEILEDK